MRSNSFVGSGRDAFGLFKSAGAKVSVSWQQSDHELTIDEIQKAKEWLHNLIR